MNFQDDPRDPDWKLTKTKGDSGTVKEPKPKYSQRFCEKWLNVFSPWLARCEDDPHKPFCRACQCRLDCNRCHLQRHERTSKHARNLEILINKGEGAARQNLSIRQERSKYYQQRKKCNGSVGSQEDSDMGIEDFIDEVDQENEYAFEPTDLPSEEFVPDDNNSEMMGDETVDDHMIASRTLAKHGAITRSRKTIKTPEDEINAEDEDPERKGGIKLLMQIHKDKNELMDSFKEFMGGNGTQNSPPRDKNHVDLFFESVSSSVKALSPKLIAEAKMRVSQLICELELRSISDDSLSNQHHSNTTTTMVLSPESTNSYIISQSMGIGPHGDGVHHYEELS